MLFFSISKWNKKDIGINLKSWINSVQQLPLLNETEPQYVTYRKKAVKDQRTNVLMFIGKVDCSYNKTIGPVWKIGGLTSKRQFHNGFFYGNVDKQETVTGKHVLIYKIINSNMSVRIKI